MLHAAGVLPRDDMEPVVSLLLDGEEQIRTAAAAVIPSLMTSNMDATETDGAVGSNVRTTANTASVADGVKGGSYATLLSIVHIIKGLKGSRARTASTVDALWDIYHSVLSDWNLICTMLLSEDPDADRNPPLKSEDAAGLTNLLCCSVRRALGEHLVRAEFSGGHGVHASSQRPPTKAQRDAQEHARESFTQVGRCRLTLSKPTLKAPGIERLKLTRDDPLSNFAFKFNLRPCTQVAMKQLPLVLRRWSSDEVGRCRLTL